MSYPAEAEMVLRRPEAAESGKKIRGKTPSQKRSEIKYSRGEQIQEINRMEPKTSGEINESTGEEISSRGAPDGKHIGGTSK